MNIIHRIYINNVNYKKYRKCANTILQEMFWKIIRVCLERYSENLANVLVGGILTSEERIREVMNLVEQNLDEETMLKKLREIRVRDNLPMR